MESGDDIDSFFSEINALPAPEAEQEAVVAPASSISIGPQGPSAPAEIGPQPPPSSRSTPSAVETAPTLKSHHLPIAAAARPQPQLQQHQQHPLVSSRGGFATSYTTTFAAPPPPPPPKESEAQSKKHVRSAAGEQWVDDSLSEWPENDFRIFVGDLGNEVSSEQLSSCFSKYPSFAKAKVVKNSHDNKSKGYGFVSFLDPMDCAKAIREMDGKYCGSRPMKITKSTWKDREIKEVRKKETKKRKMIEALGLTG